MGMEVLRLRSLSKVRDGLLEQVIDSELAKIHADCVDRPGLKKPRKLIIQLDITPTGDDPLEEVNVSFKVAPAKLPPTEVQRRLKHIPRSRGFGFDSDTDSIDHSPDQRRLEGIDGEDDV